MNEQLNVLAEETKKMSGKKKGLIALVVTGVTLLVTGTVVLVKKHSKKNVVSEAEAETESE